MIQVVTQLVLLVWGDNLSGDNFEDEFSRKTLPTFVGLFQWLMLDQIQTAVSSLSFKATKIPYAQKELERGIGQNQLIAEFYATNGGTPRGPSPYRIWPSWTTIHTKFLDEIANVETGAQDRPVEDNSIETIEVVD